MIFVPNILFTKNRQTHETYKVAQHTLDGVRYQVVLKRAMCMDWGVCMDAKVLRAVRFRCLEVRGQALLPIYRHVSRHSPLCGGVDSHTSAMVHLIRRGDRIGGWPISMIIYKNL